MAEAITILGAIRTSQQVLWDFSQLIRRYRHLPRRVQDLEENLNSCQVALRIWKRQWDVSDHHPDLYYEILWGKRGWRDIQDCLKSIKLLASLVRGEIDRLVGSAFKFQGQNRHYRYDGHFDRRTTRRALDRIDLKMSRKRRFFWSVILRANDMDAQIARFNTKLTNLDRLAEGYLLDTHPDLFDKDPSQRYRERQGLIQDGMRDEMRKAVRNTREDAEGVHAAWAATDDLKCHLAIANGDFKSSRDAIINEQLHFVLANGEKARELQVTPAKFKGPGVRKLPDSLNDVSKSIYKSSQRDWQLLPPDAKHGIGFKIYAPPRSSLAKLDARQPLSNLLSDQSTDNKLGTLKTEEKLTVAVGMIEGCYRYLGTPWLNHLDSANVRGDRTSQGSWMALLEAKPGNRNVSQALTQLSTKGPYKGLSLESHKQIFRLGIILTELAVGSLVTYAEASDDIKVPGVSLVFEKLAEDDRLSAEEIASEVENRTGSEIYANLVRFCLSVLQNRTKIKTLKVDDAYEKELLESTKDLTRILRS